MLFSVPELVRERVKNVPNALKTVRREIAMRAISRIN